MRLAYFSPLNPVQSGISDYSEELLPFLARGATVDLFIDKYKPSNPAIPAQFRVLPARRFDAANRAAPYDSPIYQMGNSPAHAYIYERLLKTPGVLVLHEFVLHHLRMWMALRRGKGRAYLQAMRATYGEAGRQAAERVLLGQHPEALFNFPLVEEALARATGVIVHSRYMAAQVRQVRADVPLAVVNMGVPLPPYVPRDVARARLGLAPDVFILSSMGHLNPYKRLNVALRAFKALVMQYPRALFLLVGSRSPNYNVDRMISMLGLQERVRVIGYAPPAEFADYLAASDVCINLRFPTAGETSAALLRIMGGGKPVLVSAVGSFTELPDAAAAKVDVGGIEEELLLEDLLLLARRPDLRLAMGRAARRYVAEQHTLEGAARGYLTFLADLLGQPAPVADLVPPPYQDDMPTVPDPPLAPPLRPAAPARPAAVAAPAAMPAPSPAPSAPAPPPPTTPLATLAAAAAACAVAPDDPLLPALLRRVDGLL
jgi:glycosyltransferase involved in cell wall biosynthesis